MAALHGKNSGDIQAAFNDNETDGFSPNSGLYHVTVDILVWHKEE